MAKHQTTAAHCNSTDASTAPNRAITRVTLERIGSGARGDRWRVTHAGGVVLVDSSRDPEHYACRALLALGVTGTVETWHAGAKHAAMRIDIEHGAGRSVSESQTGLRNRRWVPFEHAERNLMPIAAVTADRPEAFEDCPLPPSRAERFAVCERL